MQIFSKIKKNYVFKKAIDINENQIEIKIKIF